MTKSYAEIAEIIQQLRSFHIETERDREFEAQLSRLFKIGEDGALSHLPVLYTGGTETRGITFIEPAGGGKTTAINRVFH